MMQARRMVGYVREHAPMSDFRFGQSAAFEMLDGIVKMPRGLGIADTLRCGLRRRSCPPSFCSIHIAIPIRWPILLTARDKKRRS